MNAKSEVLRTSCSPELKARVEAQAHRERYSTAHLVRKALWAYLADKAAKERRESLRAGDVLTMQNGSTITAVGQSKEQVAGSKYDVMFYTDDDGNIWKIQAQPDMDLEDEAYVAACIDGDVAEQFMHERGGYEYQESEGE